MNKPINISRGGWGGFGATHIFPLEKEDPLWTQGGFGRWMGGHTDDGPKINSLQNGMLLQTTVYQLFNQYLVSVRVYN